jgi:hypothetical protein
LDYPGVSRVEWAKRIIRLVGARHVVPSVLTFFQLFFRRSDLLKYLK